jgi:hypothetical protein
MPQYAASQLACPREPESSNEPYPPCPATGLSPSRPCRVWGPGPRGALLGVVTLGYSGQLVGVEAIAAITAGPTCPLTSRDHRLADDAVDRPRRAMTLSAAA